MTNATDSSPKNVVLTPDLIGYSLSNTAGLRVMELWRDQHIIPVVNRDLLLRYLRLLRELGLGPDLTRRWLWWFTAAGKSKYLKEVVLPARNGYQLCSELASQSSANCVLWAGIQQDTEPNSLGGISTVRWISASDFITQHEAR